MVPSKPLLLEVERLSVHFGGLVALSSVSFGVPRGEIVGLLGPNGAGKTTLFNVLSGIVRPTIGRIRFQGHDITNYRIDLISRLGISRTFQLIRVFQGLSVLDNIRVGGLFGRSLEAPPIDATDIQRLLTLTNLGHFAHRPANSLAIGDRKRLEIARALATRPALLLLDEVLAGLALPDARALIDSSAPSNSKAWRLSSSSISCRLSWSSRNALSSCTMGRKSPRARQRRSCATRWWLKRISEKRPQVPTKHEEGHSGSSSRGANGSRAELRLFWKRRAMAFIVCTSIPCSCQYDQINSSRLGQVSRLLRMPSQ